MSRPPHLFSPSSVRLIAMLSIALVSFCGLFVIVNPDSGVVLRGTVVHDADGAAIPYVTIRVSGTAFGCVANEEGAFSLPVRLFPITLRFSHLGFRPDSVVLNAPQFEPISVLLSERTITLACVDVVGMDPAEAAMRPVIESIGEFRRRKRSYAYRAISKSTVRTDTALVSVAAAAADVWYDSTETVRRSLVWSKSWFAADSSIWWGEIARPVDLTAGNIRIWLHTGVGPLSRDALDTYEFTLDSTHLAEGQRLQFVSFRPRSHRAARFTGSIVIDAEREAVLRIVVSTEEAAVGAARNVTLGSLRIVQEFGDAGDRWIPTQVRTTAELAIREPVGSTVLRFTQLTAIEKKRFLLDEQERREFERISATRQTAVPMIDSLELERVPLTSIERCVLMRLDTTGRIRPLGKGTRGGLDLHAAFNPLNVLLAEFHRSSGLFFGITATLPFRPAEMRIVPSLAIGTADQCLYWQVRSEYPVSRMPMLSVSLEAFRWLGEMPERRNGRNAGMIADLISGRRDHETMRTNGWSLAVGFRSTGSALREATFAFRSVNERTASLETSWSVLTGRVLPESPLLISEGWWRELHFDLRAGNIDATCSWWGRDWTHPTDRHGCATIALDDTLHIGSARFSSSPVLRISATMSGVWGSVPPQRAVVLPGRAWVVAPQLAFRSVGYREYTGEKLASVFLEFNARDLPFRVIGLESSILSWLDVTAHAGVASIHDERHSVIAESGAGFAGFAGLLRIEVTHQWKPHARTVLSIGTTVDW